MRVNDERISSCRSPAGGGYEEGAWCVELNLETVGDAGELDVVVEEVVLAVVRDDHHVYRGITLLNLAL